MQMLSTAKGWVAANLNKMHLISLLLHVMLKGWKWRLKGMELLGASGVISSAPTAVVWGASAIFPCLRAFCNR